MAKTSVVVRNEKRKKTVKKYAAKRAELLAKCRDTTLSMSDRVKARRAMQKLPRNASPVRVRNRCTATGRPRGVYADFGLSRGPLLELWSLGQIPGLESSSW